MTRISSVRSVNVLNVSNTSVFEIGDSVNIDAYSRVLALQRERSFFIGEEHDFIDYDVFSRPVPQPIVHETLELDSINQEPIISVDHLEVISVSTSGVLHIGSTERIRGETHVKHIRHLLR
ncbi:spore germination protein GerPE [Ammoniphilus sp. CFH 90114]|uniref:spore germination protein GerPE n=1 Tax=Ammoniphilus sp. CFH 90114 TaxID=2493665 RepID=UPI0013E964A3|nr:spore germination protein GerPE [Ammoniphilus sp. CFH 90114]